MANKTTYISEEQLEKIANDFATKMIKERKYQKFDCRKVIVESFCAGFNATQVSTGEIDVPGF